MGFSITFGIIIVVVIIIVAVIKSIEAHKANIETGVEAMIGKIGTAKTNIEPSGKFYVNGEYWTAEVRGMPLNEGDRGRVIEIKSADEQYLIIERVE